MGAPDPVRAQTDAVLAVVGESLGPSIQGAYLYGSAVAGGLRAESDLDLLVVLDRRTTLDEKRRLIEGISPLSRRRTRPAGWRPVELTVVVGSEVQPWRDPPRFDFQYGEWLRAEFDAGNLEPWPSVNPDVAVLLTMVRLRSWTLAGPPATDLLDPVPHGDLVRAMVAELDSLLADLADDTRNVLLTLARMWSTIEIGEIRSKDEAAEWALARLPKAYRPVLALARDAYLGDAEDRWDELLPEARAHSAYLAAQIRRLAAPASTGRDPA